MGRLLPRLHPRGAPLSVIVCMPGVPLRAAQLQLTACCCAVSAAREPNHALGRRPRLISVSATHTRAQVLPVTEGTRVALVYELFARPGMHMSYECTMLG